MTTKSNPGNDKSRRDFFKTVAATAAGMAAMPLAGQNASAAGTVKSKVCVVRSAKDIEPGEDSKAIISKMLEEGIRYISGGEPEKFWKATFNPKDKVGIKVNTTTERHLNFGPWISMAIAEQLMKVGIEAESILVWDRDTKALKKTGYKVNTDGAGVRCYGTSEVGHCDWEFTSGDIKAKFSKIIETSSALVNIPILKTHALAGVSITMKNHYGSFDTPNNYHANACDPFIADLNARDEIKNRQRLVVCDATRVLYAGGPEMAPNFISNFNGLIIGTDPVAVDFVGYEMIKRIRKELPHKAPYVIKPIHIATAAKKGLGKGEKSEIDFKEIIV